MKLSAAIITLNEERNLAACLDSLDFCDEWVVVDSLSQDATCEIARSKGAKVIDQAFLGHVRQKQLAVDSCSHDWVLCLDADERISPELRASILALKNQEEPELAGYQVNRLSWHLGRWIRHGGWYPDRNIRLFDRRRGHWAGYDPHDKVEVEGPVGLLTGDLHHYVFKDLAHNVATNNSYSGIMAKDLAQAGKGPSLLKLLFKPPWKFVECYVLKAGFLDGMAGFIIAVGAAYSLFLKFAKLWEQQTLDPGDSEQPRK
ncbi:MAG: glycosyltransferase family 2 protein [bacterium]|nr:glycosyltransferase family 2 protein [bacterium]